METWDGIVGTEENRIRKLSAGEYSPHV